jgi:hypothetical protein
MLGKMVARISSSYRSALAAVVQPRQNLTIMSDLSAYRTHAFAAVAGLVMGDRTLNN